MTFTEYTDNLKVLGLKHKSTLNIIEVKKAYKKLVLKHHPDKFKSEENKAKATENFKKITKAYEYVLDNLEIYRNYDIPPDKEEPKKQKQQKQQRQKQTGSSLKVQEQKYSPPSKPKDRPPFMELFKNCFEEANFFYWDLDHLDDIHKLLEKWTDKCNKLEEKLKS